MIHNSVIIELPASSCQHRKYVLPTAATPLQNKSPPRQETLHPQLKENHFQLYFLMREHPPFFFLLENVVLSDVPRLKVK